MDQNSHSVRMNNRKHTDGSSSTCCANRKKRGLLNNGGRLKGAVALFTREIQLVRGEVWALSILTREGCVLLFLVEETRQHRPHSVVGASVLARLGFALRVGRGGRALSQNAPI